MLPHSIGCIRTTRPRCRGFFYVDQGWHRWTRRPVSPPLRWGGAGRSNVGQGKSEGPQDRIKDNCLAAKKREKKVERQGDRGDRRREPAERYRATT